MNAPSLHDADRAGQVRVKWCGPVGCVLANILHVAASMEHLACWCSPGEEPCADYIPGPEAAR